MEKPFILLVEDKIIGRFRTEQEAHDAGVKLGGAYFEILDFEAMIHVVREVRKMTG